MRKAAKRARQTLLQGHATASLAAVWRLAFRRAGAVGLVLLATLGSVLHICIAPFFSRLECFKEPLPTPERYAFKARAWLHGVICQAPPTDHTPQVIVSTNLAETSVTINGVVYSELEYSPVRIADALPLKLFAASLLGFFSLPAVIDCGFVKLRAFSPETCLGSW